jgi:hypothetical protein
VRSAVVGRPVRFVGAAAEEDDALALSRLRASRSSRMESRLSLLGAGRAAHDAIG